MQMTKKVAASAACATMVAGLAVGFDAAGPVAFAGDSPKAQSSVAGQADVVVQLFQWPWESVAAECTSVLGPKGFGAVQVSPPQEHVVLDEEGHPWWQDYQVVSYLTDTRRGDREDFKDMVAACHDAGVEVYADVVVNHTTGPGSGVGSAGSEYSYFDHPAVPYEFDDFHHCGRGDDDVIEDFDDPWEVQNCHLLGLADLATEEPDVRSELAAYLADLMTLDDMETGGVDGFRVDGAKHMPAEDVSAIIAEAESLAGREATVFTEVIGGTPAPADPESYTDIGAVTEFAYGPKVSEAFRGGEIWWLPGSVDNDMVLDSADAMAFVDNHDTERDDDNDPLTYKEPEAYAMANAFLLAHPYGRPQLMSGFEFDSYDQGPPAAADGVTDPAVDDSGQCQDGWVCQHRWTSTANLVEFRQVAADAEMTDMYADESDPQRLAFGREAAGYVAFNAGDSDWEADFDTSLASGTYCDVAEADFVDGECLGQTYDVDADGGFVAAVPASGVLALHRDAVLE